MCVCIYALIYIEREREKEREAQDSPRLPLHTSLIFVLETGLVIQQNLGNIFLAKICPNQQIRPIYFLPATEKNFVLSWAKTSPWLCYSYANTPNRALQRFTYPFNYLKS